MFFYQKILCGIWAEIAGLQGHGYRTYLLCSRVCLPQCLFNSIDSSNINFAGVFDSRKILNFKNWYQNYLNWTRKSKPKPISSSKTSRREVIDMMKIWHRTRFGYVVNQFVEFDQRTCKETGSRFYWKDRIIGPT